MATPSSQTLLIILIVIIGFFLAFEYTRRIKRFMARHRYFKMELNRAPYGERNFWRKKIFKEYLSLVPFAGILLKKRKR